jgi:hypothetical protein
MTRSYLPLAALREFSKSTLPLPRAGPRWRGLRRRRARGPVPRWRTCAPGGGPAGFPWTAPSGSRAMSERDSSGSFGTVRAGLSPSSVSTPPPASGHSPRRRLAWSTGSPSPMCTGPRSFASRPLSFWGDWPCLFRPPHPSTSLPRGPGSQRAPEVRRGRARTARPRRRHARRGVFAVSHRPS